MNNAAIYILVLLAQRTQQVSVGHVPTRGELGLGSQYSVLLRNVKLFSKVAVYN